jgi:2-dehydrotetronate isomerase
MLRFDPNLRCLFTELPMLERYEAAAMAGFRGIEVAFPYDEPARELGRRLADLGLTLVQMLSPFDWDAGLRGIAALPGREKEFRGSIARAIDYALEVGKPMVHVMAGNVESGVQRERCLGVFEANLAYAADLARPAGITLIIEPCCAARFPRYLYQRVDQGVRVIERVGRDNVKLCFDTFHVQMEEGAITPKLESTWAHVGHIQIGNVPGRHEPGTGEIHFPYLFSQIERLDWQGWIGCEYTPSGPTLDTLGWGMPYGIGGRTGPKRRTNCWP